MYPGGNRSAHHRSEEIKARKERLRRLGTRFYREKGRVFLSYEGSEESLKSDRELKKTGAEENEEWTVKEE